jgi:hypothetical protein
VATLSRPTRSNGGQDSRSDGNGLGSGDRIEVLDLFRELAHIG